MQRLLGGRYELVAAIGSGGFGTVFRARDRRTGLDVAVKLVLPGLGSEPAAIRLRREGAVVRRVASRHVARVFDTGDDESGVWLVTELVDGAPLTVENLGRALLPHEVLRVARGLLEGLAAVHAAGIVHGDVKPSNVLAPRGDKALDGVMLVDFGLARVMARAEVAASIGAAMTHEGTVLGTARYMAPEVLTGAEPSPRSDLYAAGLVLFELLDDGPLFPVGDARAQLRARLTSDPYLEERVPEPLSDVFARLLARDPAGRYRDGAAAYEAVSDLDTAPVSVNKMDETALAPRRRPSGAPPVLPTIAPARAPPAMSSPPPPVVAERVLEGPPSVMPPPSRRPSGVSPPLRLTSLPADGVVALRETLRHLDLPMLDALARRERGNAIGRIARGVALALRLEIDAAALILEPLAMQSDVARAIGASVLAPRARRVTRARVDSDREDRWVDTIDAELAAMLVALAAALSGVDDTARDADRCSRALARLDALGPSGITPTVDATRTTVRVAHAAARVRRGELDRAVAVELMMPAAARNEPRVEAPFHDVVRALSAGALFSSPGIFSRSLVSSDVGRVGAELERAERIAADTGTTLLDACATTTLGTLLVAMSPADERGLLALERAGTLLAHGDAPGLEHEAELQRATVLIALGRWDDARVHLRAAREAANAERAADLEVLAAALQTLAEVAAADRPAAFASAALLGEARLATANGRAAAFAWIARAASASDRPAMEDAMARAEARVREVDRKNADAHVLVEAFGMLVDAARVIPPDASITAARADRFVAEHGATASYWLGLLSAVAGNVHDGETSRKMQATLARLRSSSGNTP